MIYKNEFKREFHNENMHLYQADCMEMLKQTPDNYYDLSICDPPYGINHSEIAGKQSNTKYGNAATK